MQKSEELKLVTLLKQLEPGFLPYDIFVQIARLVALPIIEFVPLRIKNNSIEILLLERSKHDDIWPGEVHVPGTVVRATDNDKNTYKAFERILIDELEGTKVSNPYYVGSILHKSKRGMEQSQVFWVEVLEEPEKGVFYPTDKLPANLIQSQVTFITQAVESFRQKRI